MRTLPSRSPSRSVNGLSPSAGPSSNVSARSRPWVDVGDLYRQDRHPHAEADNRCLPACCRRCVGRGLERPTRPGRKKVAHLAGRLHHRVQRPWRPSGERRPDGAGPAEGPDFRRRSRPGCRAIATASLRSGIATHDNGLGCRQHDPRRLQGRPGSPPATLHRNPGRGANPPRHRRGPHPHGRGTRPLRRPRTARARCRGPRLRRPSGCS